MSYLARKLEGICVRKGCPEPQQDDCLLCAPHQAESRLNTKHSMRAIRRRRELSREQLPLFTSNRK